MQSILVLGNKQQEKAKKTIRGENPHMVTCVIIFCLGLVRMAPILDTNPAARFPYYGNSWSPTLDLVLYLPASPLPHPSPCTFPFIRPISCYYYVPPLLLENGLAPGQIVIDSR